MRATLAFRCCSTTNFLNFIVRYIHRNYFYYACLLWGDLLIFKMQSRLENPAISEYCIGLPSIKNGDYKLGVLGLSVIF
jgi:hypothetical protein